MCSLPSLLLPSLLPSSSAKPSCRSPVASNRRGRASLCWPVASNLPSALQVNLFQPLNASITHHEVETFLKQSATPGFDFVFQKVLSVDKRSMEFYFRAASLFSNLPKTLSEWERAAWRQLAWGLRTGRQIRERSLRIVGELEQVAIFAR